MGIIGAGAVFYRYPPPHPPTFKYYHKHRLGGVRPQAQERPVGHDQERPTRHWLDTIGSFAVSKVSLSLTVAVRIDADRSQRGDEGRREHERVLKGSGGGSTSFSRGKSGGY